VNEIRVDGGAAVNNLLMQIQSNIIKRKVVRPMITETTALGAAYLAGLATNFWKDINELKEQWKADRIFSAGGDEKELERVLRNWEKAVERSKNWFESHLEK
jgi:glycerol kinase